MTSMKKSGPMMVRNMMMMIMRSPPQKRPGPDPPPIFSWHKCSEHNVPRMGWGGDPPDCSSGFACVMYRAIESLVSNTLLKPLSYTRGALHAACCRSSLKEIAGSIYMCMEERLGVQNDLMTSFVRSSSTLQLTHVFCC